MLDAVTKAIPVAIDGHDLEVYPQISQICADCFQLVLNLWKSV